MIHRLPGWVWFGGFVLAAVAGVVNAVGLLGIQHQGLTHMTGTVSLAGVDAAQRDWAGAWAMGKLVMSFVLGASLSGALIGESTLRLGRRYGLALMTESLLLVAATLLLRHERAGGEYLICAAAGLQNAMATTFSGAIVRTTHVTGVLTDLGVAMGRGLCSWQWEWRKVGLLTALAGGFVSGSFGGAVLYMYHGPSALWLPVTITGFAGFAYIVLRRWHWGGSD